MANVSQCAEYHRTYCTKNDDYPREYMQQVLQTHFDQYGRFFDARVTASKGSYSKNELEISRDSTSRKKSGPPSTTPFTTDFVNKETFRQNAPAYNFGFKSSIPMQENGDDDEIELCDTVDKVIYPTSATSETGVGLFIFNSDDHKQGVHVSICQSTGKPCDDFVVLRNNYRSECKQQTIYRELLSLSPQGKPIKERFEFPASCNCILRRIKIN